jgi:hypothetical protein
VLVEVMVMGRKGMSSRIWGAKKMLVTLHRDLACNAGGMGRNGKKDWNRKRKHYAALHSSAWAYGHRCCFCMRAMMEHIVDVWGG